MQYDRIDDLEKLIQLAIKEDIGNADITTTAIFTGDEYCEGQFIAKEAGVIAGIELVKRVFPKLSDEIKFIPLIEDGTFVSEKTIIAKIKGPADVVLTAERTVLNFLQRMSGIASLTRRFADEISHTKAKILDTRKTVPGHRISDKWAVKLGGGQNHRIRLDDRYLIKENHITVAGSLSKAVQLCNEHKIKNELQADIEVEVENLGEFLEVHHQFQEVVKYVMLDNMSIEDMKKAVLLNKNAFLLEASGNVTLETVREIAETGVDFISSGSLTHSVKALDITLLLSIH